MKICPYCAEKIQDDAVVCRFCNRPLKVEGAEEGKKCPYCAEWIKKEAIVCRYCKNSLRDSGRDGTAADSKTPNPNVPSEEPATIEHQDEDRKVSPVLIGILSGLGVALLIFFGLHFSEISAVCASTSAAPTYCSSLMNNALFHFIINWITWGLLVTAVVFAFRRAWRQFGFSLLLGAIIYFSVIALAVAGTSFSTNQIDPPALPANQASVATETSTKAPAPTSTSRPTATSIPWIPDWAPEDAKDSRRMHEHFGETVWVCGGVRDVDFPFCVDCWPYEYLDLFVGVEDESHRIRAYPSSYDSENLVPAYFLLGSGRRICAFGTIQAIGPDLGYLEVRDETDFMHD